MIWYNVISYYIILYYTIRHGMICYDMTWYTMWYYVFWHAMTYDLIYDIVWYGILCYDIIYYGEGFMNVPVAGAIRCWDGESTNSTGWPYHKYHIQHGVCSGWLVSFCWLIGLFAVEIPSDLPVPAIGPGREENLGVIPSIPSIFGCYRLVSLHSTAIGSLLGTSY